jgi:L-threonylcarbamoyladenylate synthase
LSSLNNFEIQKAISLLQQNDVIAIPTETVYGLAGNAFNETAVAKIFEIKQRPLYNPLIVHIKSIEFLNTVAQNIPAIAMQLAQAFWPGPLTLVLEKKDCIPDIVTAGKKSVAVRIPNHALCLQLLNALDFPLAAPSANPFGKISPTSASHVAKQLGSMLPFILDGGPCEKGLESTIIGFENETPILLRVGALSQEIIEQVIGPIKNLDANNKTILAPGMLAKHYSPNTKFIATNDVAGVIQLNSSLKIGVIKYCKSENNNVIHTEIILSPTANINEAAQNLYNTMHRLDEMQLDLIIAETFKNEGLGKTINDRLQRAMAE